MPDGTYHGVKFDPEQIHRMPEATSQRLAGEFRQKIERGEWAVGRQLPTTRELAMAYHVSVNTIKTAFRELEADEMVERRPRIGGYVKARFPRSSGLRASTTVAVIGPQSVQGDHVAEDWGYRIIRGLDAGLMSSGFHFSTYSYQMPDDGTALRKVLEKVDQAGEMLAGCLCFLTEPVAALPEELDRRNIPWVTVNRSKEHAAHNFVSHEAFRGAKLIARCFARMGFERVAILSNALGGGASTGDKYHGFLDGWVEAGMPGRFVDFVPCATGYEDVGHDAFAAYLKQYGPPRAVFAAGDFLALGAIRACREWGLAVPEQVAVIGSTGLEVAAYSHPSLTVLDTPMEQMGAEAAQMLLEMAREGVRRMSGRYVQTKLTVRESCPIPADVIQQEQSAIGKSI